MPDTILRIDGLLVGHRLDRDSGADADVVHLPRGHAPDGPAESSFVLVDRSRDRPTARYLSWINYFDLEYAIHREPGGWRIVEPATPYAQEVRWSPWGWPGARGVPTIGDALLARAAGNGGGAPVEVAATTRA